MIDSKVLFRLDICRHWPYLEILYYRHMSLHHWLLSCSTYLDCYDIIIEVTRGTRQSASTLISRSRLYTSSSLHRKSKSVLLTAISVPTHKASAALLLLLLLLYSRSWVRHVDPAAKASLFLMARYVISIWRRQSTDRNVSRWDTTKLAWLLKHECMYLCGCIIDIRGLPWYNVRYQASGIFKTSFYLRSKITMCKYLSYFKVPLVVIIYLRRNYWTWMEKLKGRIYVLRENKNLMDRYLIYGR